ncbi:alpha/beta hydrolase [Microbulbifer yueqingensis]|uniref:Predicted hydrolase of the alpha/beta superfamily n=1 Tax=Microbulbifer yueqingensis TaxID=658219 RepID=A0A1G8Y7Z8_9GAMM|nr:alpha/beta hydrolase-fold protein [Microbulbifer yueqingensis]SDJ99009.1 Predicted hydrolase of the alpha/beta superfamily [Microbulbifer yueqingensis]
MHPNSASGNRLLLLAGLYLLSVLVTMSAVAADADKVPVPGTATANVRVLPAMQMERLARERTVRLYLPPGYEGGDRRYPVLYMHDGQNLFDDATAYAGEWGVDETLNRLAAERGLDLIVVGIDHGGEHRIHELTPFDHPKYAAAEGEAYLEFVVHQLKPYIDGHFRTLAGREHTAIMGSSLGGLISHYAMLRYPQVFSRAAIFSPAYWIAPPIHRMAENRQGEFPARMYLLMGGAEGEEMLEGYRAMKALLSRKMPATSWHASLVDGAAHNEGFWRTQFAPAVTWLFDQPARQDETGAE